MLREYSDKTRWCECKIMAFIFGIAAALSLFLPYIENWAAVTFAGFSMTLLGYNKGIYYKNNKEKQL